jgi:hypothetical protein
VFSTAGGKDFEDATEAVFGNLKMLARAIKARIERDGIVDILVGTNETQVGCRWVKGMAFVDVTVENLSHLRASVGDLEGTSTPTHLDVALADWGRAPGSSVVACGFAE